MSQETWADAVLAVLGKRPRRAWTLQEIYGEIEKHSIVTRHHHIVWGSQPNLLFRLPGVA